MRLTAERFEAFLDATADADKVAERLLRWAEQVEAGSEINRATLLMATADAYASAGEDERRLELCRRAVADEFLAEILEGEGRHLEAAQVATIGLDRVENEGPGLAAVSLALVRRRCREHLGLVADELDLSAETLSHLLGGADPLDGVEVALPPGELERDIVTFVTELGWQEFTAVLSAGFADFAAQCAAIEQTFRTRPEGLPRVCVPIELATLRAYADTLGAPVDERGLRVRFSMWATCQGLGTSWPPGRNQPCWCGRPAKYKKCCGRAGGASS